MRLLFRIVLVLLFTAACTPVPQAAAVPTVSPQPALTPTPLPTEQPASISPYLRIGNGTLTQVRWSPAGDTVIVGTSAGVFVYSTKDFTLIRAFEIGKGVYQLAVHPGGEILSTGSDLDPAGHNTLDQITLWNVRTGRPETTLSANCGCGFSAGAFSPDGSLFAAGNGRGQVWVWNWASGNIIRILNLKPSKEPFVGFVQFDPQGSALLAGEESGDVELFDVASGDPLRSYDNTFESIGDVLLSPDGKQVAVSGRLPEVPGFYINRDTLTVFDRSTGKVVYTVDPKVERIAFAVYSPDGKSLVIGSCPDYGLHAEICPQARLERWNARDGTRANAIAEELRAELVSADYSADGKQVALITDGGDAGPIFEIRNPENGQTLKTIAWFVGPSSPILFSADSRTAIYGRADGTIELVDVETGKLIASLAARGQRIADLAINSGGTLLAGSSLGDAITLWDLKTKTVTLTIAAGEGGYHIHTLRFSPDQRRLAWAESSLDGADRVRIYDLQNRSVENTLTGGSIFDLAISPDSSTIALGDFDQKTVRLFEMGTGRLLKTLETPDDIEEVRFSPDGNTLAAAAFNMNVLLWQTSNGKLLHSFDVYPESRIGSAPFEISPDNRFLVVSLGHRLKVFELAKYSQILEKRPFAGGTDHLTISPDGNLLASSGWTDAAWLSRLAGMP